MSRARWIMVVVMLGVIAMAFAACNGDGDGTPTEPAATQPTEAAGGTPAGGTGTRVEVSAQNIAFQPSELTAPAGQAFTVVFTNQDGLAHSFALYRDEEYTDLIVETAQEGGPTTIELPVEALEAGEYYFRCEVHPQQMEGTLTAQ